MKLIQTCSAAPEQYDLMDGDERIGYLRLRHGHFAAHAYGPSGPIVYKADTIGDGLFESHERDQHIKNAVAAIIAYVGVEIEYES